MTYLNKLSPALLCLALLTACAGNPAAREAAHMKKAQAYLEKDQVKKAVIELKVAAQNMPKDPEPVFRLGMTYLRAGAGASALEMFRTALRLDPNHEPSRYQFALFEVASAKQADVEDAQQALLQHLKLQPADPEAMAALALAQAKLGNTGEAVKLIEAAVLKDPSNLRPEAMLIALYSAKSDTITAKSIATNIAGKLPQSPGAATLRAEVALASRELAETDREISRALNLQRNFRPALELRLRREVMDRDAQAAENTMREISRLPEKDTWAAYGRLLFLENKVDRAKQEFERVLKEHADDVDIRNEYSRQLAAAGRNQDAEAVVAGTLAKSPRNLNALLQRTTLEIDRGDLDAATRDMKTLRESKSVSAELSFQESRIFAARGETIRQGDLLTESLTYNPGSLKARFHLARLLIASGKARNALLILDEASPKDKTNADYVYNRNAALIAGAQWAEAAKAVAVGLKIFPAPGLYYQDAFLKARSKDLAGARKSLESGLQMAPADTQSLFLLGQLMRQQKQLDLYLARLKDVAAKNTGSAPLQTLLAAWLTETGDRSGARAAYEAAKAAGDPVDADFEIARQDLASGALDPARQRLLRLIQTHDNAKSRLMLAQVEMQRGTDPQAAVAHYLQALKLEPSNVTAMNNLAETLATRQNKLDDAVFWGRKAVTLDPDNPITNDTLGWALFRQGKYGDALPHLDKSTRIQDRPLAHYHLAAVLAKFGDPARARREYRLAVKQDPQSEARKAVSDLMESR